LVTASTGLGGSLFSIILAGVIEAGSWRVSYLVSAVLIGIMGLLIFLLGRNRPQDMGLQPFGHGTGHGKKSRKENRDHWHGEDAKTVMRRPSFVLMLLVVFFSSTCIYAAFPVVAPHLQDCGMTAGEAASLQSIMLLSLALAKFLCGALSDWVGSKKVNLLCMGCCVVGLTLLALVNGTAVAAVAMIVFSVGVVLTTITVPLLSSSLFGYHPQGGIIGIFMALIPAANVITTPVVNMLYDRIGSYSPIFLVFAGIGLATLAAMLVLYRLAGNDRKRYEATHPTEPEE